MRKKEKQERDRRTLEEITNLVCKYEPELLDEYGGLSKFVEWIRSLDSKKLYKKD